MIDNERMRRLIGIALMAAILAAPAFATTVVRLNLEQLVQRADLIVQGQVQSVHCQWDEERHLVFTYISIRVDEPLKGERRQSVLIRQIGGSVGTIQMSVAGVPQFKSGEMAIVFLKRQDDSTFQVVGMSQGLYRSGRKVLDFGTASRIVHATGGTDGRAVCGEQLPDTSFDPLPIENCEHQFHDEISMI
jgi:hypothetical protein